MHRQPPPLQLPNGEGRSAESLRHLLRTTHRRKEREGHRSVLPLSLLASLRKGREEGGKHSPSPPVTLRSSAAAEKNRDERRHWTHGGAQHDIPRGGRSHKGKRSTRRHENQRIELAPPSLPQLQPLNPSTIVAPPPFISPMVPPMMTPYHVNGGFFPPMVEEEIAQPQQCEAESGYLNWVNPLNIVDQSFPQLTNRHSNSCIESYRLNNSEASSSNVVPLDASMGKISTTNGGTNVS
nr:dof zinc finger protein DOF4.5-like [Ipomoea batatas]